MSTQTDEVQEGTSSTASESHTGGYQNDWGEKLAAFAPDADQFKKPFTRTELGDGQVMSKAESSRLIAQHGLRQNAGAAANASLDADLEWADARIKETRLVGKQLERGIYQAKNIQLGNELLYQVGRIPLHAEKRTLQLQKLSNEVKGFRESVKITTTKISIEIGDDSGIEVDFTTIGTDEN
jgi:hypothetical protein